MTAETAAAQERKAFLIDTTAQPDNQIAGGQVVPGHREHSMMVNGTIRTYRFEHNKPVEMPWAVAAQFLRTPSFLLTNANGDPISFKGPPRQPDELQAGERIVVALDETIARLEELQHSALLLRALRMPNGESMAQVMDRETIIEFIITSKRATQQKNAIDERKADGFASFIPQAEEEEGEIALF